MTIGILALKGKLNGKILLLRFFFLTGIYPVKMLLHKNLIRGVKIWSPGGYTNMMSLNSRKGRISVNNTIYLLPFVILYLNAEHYVNVSILIIFS